MKLTYYGTGAGAGIPEIFCDCRVCRYAREKGGKEIRSRSQAVIDGVLSLDYPVDTFLHTAFYGLDMRKVKNVLITHGHFDHYLPADIFSRAVGMTEPVTFHLPVPTAAELKKSAEAREESFRNGRTRTNEVLVAVKELEMFTPVDIDKYHVIPVKARHGAESLYAMNFIIQAEGKNIFWAHDAGLPRTVTKDYLKESGILFDFVSLDCTLKRGNPITGGHMDLDRCLETLRILRQNGNVDDHTVVALSHIGHLVEQTHEELVAEAAEYGILVAYDGMTIEI